MGAEEVIATAAIVGAVGSTSAAVYSATKPGMDYKVRPPVQPGKADNSSLAMSEQAAETQAKTAGGTLLSDNKKPVGDAPNAVRKTLLGT